MSSNRGTLTEAERQRAEAAARRAGFGPSLVDELLDMHTTARDGEGAALVSFHTPGDPRGGTSLPVERAVEEFVRRNRGHLAEHRAERHRAPAGEFEHIAGVVRGEREPRPARADVDPLDVELAREFGEDLRRLA